MLEIRGHFDCSQVLLDEPRELKPNTKAIIGVLQDDDDAEWYLLGKKVLHGSTPPPPKYLWIK